MGDEPAERLVTVSIVDDAADIRSFVRVVLELDGRFEVVGEASDGVEGIELLDRVVPDLILLDRQMPRLGGVEALPEIRKRAPGTAVILYTAAGDNTTYQAAIAAGAVDVVDKTGLDVSIGDQVARILASHWAGPAPLVEVAVGPVSSDAAVLWTTNTSLILDAVRRHPDVLPQLVPEAALDFFVDLLRTWAVLAAETEEFVWRGWAKAGDVQRLVEYWAMIDRMDDVTLASLGCRWVAPEGTPFFEALTAGVMEALTATAETRELARRLADQFAPGPRQPGS
jgi:CheY-like chemotaxis protein